MDNPYLPSKASLSAVDVRLPRSDARRLASPENEHEGDAFVLAATCSTPTEAHLLKGVLEASGLSPTVADANFAQTHSWLAQAAGGVRVLVPAEQAEAARDAMAEYNAGAFQLEGEDAATEVKFVPLESPVFSPDRATLLSLLFTPAFGAALQLANAIGTGTRKGKFLAWLWFAVLGVTSAVAIAFMHRLNPGPFVVFRASISLSGITLLWYFLAGLPQTKHLIATHGRLYKQRSVALPCVATAVASLAFGWLLTEFA